MATFTATVDKRFQSPGPQPNGLQATAEGLWCIDQVTLEAHLLNWDTGVAMQTVATDTEHSSGITVDGDGNLWITSTWQLEVVKIDPTTGSELARYSDPGAGLTAGAEGRAGARRSSAHGIEWRDGHIYLASPPTQRVHVLDATTWEELRTFPTPGLRPHGIGWNADGRLWLSDTSAGTVHLLDADSGRIYDVFRVAEPDEVHGMTVRDGTEIWYCDAGTRDVGLLQR